LKFKVEERRTENEGKKITQRHRDAEEEKRGVEAR